MINSSEESLEKLRARFSSLFSKAMTTHSQEAHDELRKVEDTLRAKYLRQVGRIEQEFSDVVSSGNLSDIRDFLLKNSFIFRDTLGNLIIYTNYTLSSAVIVDCVIVGFKRYDPRLWATFVKFEQADFGIPNVEEGIANYLSGSLVQVKQWVDWNISNAEAFESQLRKQIIKDDPKVENVLMVSGFKLQTDFVMLAGRGNELPSHTLDLVNQFNAERNSIRVVTYDSLFSAIYDWNNKVQMSSGWWTEDLRESDNILVIKNRSFDVV